MGKPIRILQIVPNMHAAGLETLIMNLYRNIDKNKIQFDFLVHYTERCFYDDEIEKMGGNIYRLSFREDGNLKKYIKDLNDFFSKHHYKIIHGHMASTAFFYMNVAKKHNVPVRILHSHNTSTEKTLKGFVKHQMLKLSTIYANVFFACGQKAGEFLYGKRKFEIINNAIDLNKFKKDKKSGDELRKRLNIKNEFVIGHIGRFNTQKNHEFIVNLFEKFVENNQNSKLVLVGEGELEENIRDMVTSKKLNDKVIFFGVTKDTNAVYNMFDVFLLPSLFEGLPVVGIETQAAKCRSILSDKITTEVKVTNYIEYLPIDRKDSISIWCDALEQICSDREIANEDVSKELTDNGYNIINESKRLEKKYIQLLEEKGA